MGQGMVGERVGEQCLYFTLTNPLNWTAAHHHCQELGGDLAAPSDLLPLKAFLHQAFTRGPSLWLGASYELDEANRAVEDNVTPTKSVNGGDLEADLDTDTAALTPNDVPQPDTDQAHPTHRLVSGDTRLPSLTMLSDEGAEEMPLSDLASLRLMVDHSALFNEDHANTFSNTRFTRSLRLQSPEERSVSRDARSQDISRDRVLIERDNNPSVVDFILLGDVVEDDDPFLNSNLLPEHSNIEERSASRTSIAPHVHSGVPSTPSPEANEGSSRLGTEDVSGQDQEPSMEADEASNRQGSDTRKATMQCMLLRQIESLEYELVGRPCDEIHSFVCEFAFTFDNPLRE
ncbi:hypothetical protein Pmani_002952 [Petrolisthes manimaculis]|uniref:C-type lectin domain-containing protein n=1 Tax=Petrolisthes manimaculis TaxID=1843537 RepID=A0AAE1QHC4_9EUCA|nr:hypothetical protein Pmani_002952 [Petrolisthes manimaculis]